MTAHCRIRFLAAAVGVVLFAVGCGELYQEVAVEKSGIVVVTPPKMASPRMYPDFTQEELGQAENDYAILMRREIESVLARRLSVMPDEKIDSWLKENGLYGQHLDHDECMNAARKAGGDIVVESYIRLVPEDEHGLVNKKRQYDVDVEIRLTDVWNTDTLAVFKWKGTKEDFSSNFWALVKDMNVHAPKKK